MSMDDSVDSDCELVIDETVLISDEDEVVDNAEVDTVEEDNWHIFHPVSISSSDMKDALFNDETNKCSICNETFRYNVGLIYHLEMEHVELKIGKLGGKLKSTKRRKYSAEMTSNVAPTESRAKPDTNISKKVFCEVCRKSFTDITKLSKHAETCSMKYSCVYCKSKFSWESKYKKHLFKVHKFNAVVVCKYCSNVFGDMSALAIHASSCNRKSPSGTSVVQKESNLS